MAIKTALINVMEKAARKAARGLLRDFGEVENLQVSKKGPSDFVSTADLKAERVLRRELGNARPGFGFLLEEAGEIPAPDGPGGDDFTRWVVDPLDGTTNFLHGIPHFSISIAVEHCTVQGSTVQGKRLRREIIAGLIYDPMRDEIFWGEKGAGAFVNNRRLRVSARHSLSDSVIATGIPVQGWAGHDIFLAELPEIMQVCAGVHRAGSAALDLAYVAAGRYEGFWERGLNPWDIAAGILLVQEAGGYVTEIGGGTDMLESGSVLAASEQLHGDIAMALSRAQTKQPNKT